ncbi:hypothetical protein CBS133816_642 [Aspergillus niger]|nr:hypothetical protein CBS133816_642 [Aspergillus niger]
MDPFSITVGTLALLEVCQHLISFLRDIPAGLASIHTEIEILIAEVESLRSAVESIGEVIRRLDVKPAVTESSPYSPNQKSHNLHSIVDRCKQSVRHCHILMTRLETLVADIYGKAGSAVGGKLDALGKEFRRRDKSQSLQRLRGELSAQKQSMELLLTILLVHNGQESQGKLDQMMTKLEFLEEQLQQQLRKKQEELGRFANVGSQEESEEADATLFSLKRSLTSVTTAVSVIPRNKFFDTPQRVRSFYTGRVNYLESLRQILLDQRADESVQEQRRFVIWGLPGSGKTQFCSKFAEQNRSSFWGVFWIDASTHERAKQTYADIAKLGDVELSPKAAMHWLSSQEERWLLLIDNADDARVELDDYFPQGDRGTIIITSRNTAHKIHGNVGPRFFEFEGMGEDDSSVLLLRSAQLAQPWDADSSSCASKIARQLGFLALALIHAGYAIRENICSLKNYLKVYDGSWRKIRRASGEKYEILSAAASYEICYRGIEERATRASEDAIQLLKMFSFFHFKNIRFDILRRAVLNPAIEKDAREAKGQDNRQRPLTWYQRYRDLRVSILTFVMEVQGPPALPLCLRETSVADFDESRVRWARERPGMSTAEQAVWAHIAAVVLGRSILLPPLGESEDEELFRRDVLAHVDHIQACQEVNDQTIRANRTRRWYGLVQWPGLGSRFGREQALRYAKFSTVLAQSGRWKDAEMLQLAVKEYTHRIFGLDHPSTRRITLALAQTHWNQGRGDEAAQLQQTVLQACITSLGPNAHETLMAKDLLGQTRWQEGRYTHARTLQLEAVDGLIKLKGIDNEDTLTAMGSLGRTMAKFYENLDEAKSLLKRALDGMSKVLGPTHTKTLLVQEELALLAVQMGEEDLSEPLAMVQQVLDVRRERLGKEHPYTLLALASLARITNALCQHTKAETILRSGLSIAERNLGDSHIGTLMGKVILGTILINQSKFAEADSTLLDAMERLRHLASYRGDFHPDRLGAMIELARSYKLQGRFDESIRYCDEAIEGLKQISVTQHPLERKLRAQKEETIAMREQEGHR